ncbi:MAG: DUF6794 domain-containing protein [Candidatus Electrothrix gigas]
MKIQITFTLFILLSSIAIAKAEKDDRPFCKTVPESAKWVLAEVSEKTTLLVARMPKEGLTQLHFGLGMWIRSNIPVWGNEALINSVAKGAHPDNVGRMILEQYWNLSRKKLPEEELKRIEYFEKTLVNLKGTKLTATTHAEALQEINMQIHKRWPKDAPFAPFSLKADKGADFNWVPADMTSDLKANIKLFISYHRSLTFYDGDFLRVGDPHTD